MEGVRYLLFIVLITVLWADGTASGSVKHSNAKRTFGKDLSLDQVSVELAKTHIISMILKKQQELQNVAKNIVEFEKDRCGDLTSVGQPVTHNTRRITQGNWMKDPLCFLGVETIFVMDGYYGTILRIYANIKALKAGVSKETLKLPYPWDGTGAVVYGPHLYYNRANTNHIVKYNIQKKKQVKSLSVGGYYTRRRNYYQWGGYSGMDLAVDEQGLWAISGANGNGRRPYVLKIDVESFTIVKTWSLSHVEQMRHMGNSFMACGVFYAVDKYNGKSTTINYAYDTKTGRRWNPALSFTNQYGYNSMIDYNPREKVLYAWDHKRQVTYSLTFQKKP